MDGKLYYLGHMWLSRGDANCNLFRWQQIADEFKNKKIQHIHPYSLLAHTCLKDSTERGRIMNILLSVLSHCDVLVVCSDLSEGLFEEINFCIDNGIEIIWLEDILSKEYMTGLKERFGY